MGKPTQTVPGHEVGQDDAPHTLTADNSYSYREAASLCDVSIDTIKRRRTDGLFPGAQRVAGRTGKEWRIPTAELAAVASEEGWVLDLAAPAEPGLASPSQHDLAAPLPHAAPAYTPQADAIIEEHTNLRVELIELKAQANSHENEIQALTARHSIEIGHAGANLERVTNERDRARSDLEHERTTREQVAAELAESEKARAVSEAVTKEVRDRLAAVEAERDALIEKADAAVDALGWMGRRRFRKTR